MGLLVDGHWVDRWYDTSAGAGRFIRRQSAFRNWITPNGAAGPSGGAGFKAELGRYHLYVSLACPWAHRTLIFRALKGLESVISVSVVNWFMGEQGWSFNQGHGVIPDPIGGARFLHEVYTRSNPSYTGRVTVPVLWDKERNEIVSNESSEIIRMMNSAFDGVGAAPGGFYPVELRDMTDAFNARIYDTVNNGVYKAGFATTQEAYEEAVRPLFATLDALEERLATHGISAAGVLPRPIGGCSRHWCDSTLSMSDTSNATCAASWTTPISGDSPASSISIPVSQGRPISSISRSITIRATSRSIRPALFHSGLISTF